MAVGLAPAFALDPTGDWRVADGVANIRVAECNGSMWGAVSWEKEPGGRDTNNPDPAKATRPTLGIAILHDMKKKAGADQWAGKVYNSQDGKYYESTIKISNPDQLEIQGCVLGFLCGGETWTRVSGPIPSSPANSAARGAKSAQAKMAAPARTTGQRGGSAGQPADPVGDICLLPEIARPTH